MQADLPGSGHASSSDQSPFADRQVALQLFTTVDGKRFA
jgi:hypothetical protein